MEQLHLLNTSNITSIITPYDDPPVSNEGGDSASKSNNWGNFAKSDFVLVLYATICLIGLAGNLLVAVVLLRVPSLRSNTSYFLVHLSLVDFIVSVLVIPFKLVPTEGSASLNTGLFAELRCRLYVGQFLFWVSTSISVFSLVTVNFERFIAILYPHKYKLIFTKRNKCLIIISCWILGGLAKIFVLFVYDVNGDGQCTFLGWQNKKVQAAVGFYNFMVSFFVPFLLMVLAQWKVISTLRKQVTILMGRMASSAVNPSQQREMWHLKAAQNLVKTLLIFVLTFALCWGPVQIAFLVYNFGVYVDLSSPGFHISIILSVCNSCLNPVIYTLMNKPFRKGIRDAFRRKRSSGRVGNRSDEGSKLQTISTTQNKRN